MNQRYTENLKLANCIRKMHKCKIKYKFGIAHRKRILNGLFLIKICGLLDWPPRPKIHERESHAGVTWKQPILWKWIHSPCFTLHKPSALSAVIHKLFVCNITCREELLFCSHNVKMKISLIKIGWARGERPANCRSPLVLFNVCLLGLICVNTSSIP